jgi:hypothetical protein
MESIEEKLAAVRKRIASLAVELSELRRREIILAQRRVKQRRGWKMDRIHQAQRLFARSKKNRSATVVTFGL